MDYELKIWKRRIIMWSERYNQSNEPTMANISNFVNNELWDELCKFTKLIHIRSK